jgi:hypothetical protein
MINFQDELERLLRLADRRDAFQLLTALFLKSPEHVRGMIRSRWDFGVKWIYPNPQRLACRKNERYSSEERIAATLVYDAIEDLRTEELREKLFAWAVVYHSCLAAGIVPEEQFRRAASVSTPKMAEAMNGFITRPAEDKSMEAFMLVAHMNIDQETEIARGPRP